MLVLTADLVRLPVVEDPDLYGYYREEGGGILVGLFEPVGGPWSVDRVPDEIEFASLPPDWDRIGPYLDRAMDRFPRLKEAGVKTLVLTHMLEQIDQPGIRERIIREIAEIYDGNIIWGEDLMEIPLTGPRMAKMD